MRIWGGLEAGSAKHQVAMANPVGQYGGINDLAAAAALPGIERPYEIVKLLGIHPSFAFGTFHGDPLERKCGVDRKTCTACHKPVHELCQIRSTVAPGAAAAPPASSYHAHFRYKSTA